MVKPRTPTRSKQCVVREAPQILRDLRSLRVCVFHPHDQDGQGLTRQLERIGCQVQAFWPPLPDLPEGVDVVFFALSPDMLSADFTRFHRDDAPRNFASNWAIRICCFLTVLCQSRESTSTDNNPKDRTGDATVAMAPRRSTASIKVGFS